jgi:hypothetical protein
MSGIADFESVLYLRQAVVSDALLRFLGDPIRHLDTDVPRQLAFPPGDDQPQIRLWWDKPTVALGEPLAATISLELAGGVRQVGPASEPGRIGSVQGTVRAGARLGVTQWEGAPHLQLGVESLDLRGLRVRYADSNALPLIGIGAVGVSPQEAIARALAADARASAAVAALLRGLMGALVQAPLSYRADILSGVTAASGAHMRLFRTGSGMALALGMRLGTGDASSGGDLTQLDNLLEPHAQSNLAIAVSSAWLSARLAHLLDTGAIQQTLSDDGGGEPARVNALGIVLRKDEVTFRGDLTWGTKRAPFTLDLQCMFDSEGHRLALARQSANDAEEVSAALNRMPLAKWGEVLAALLGMSYRDGAVELSQRLMLPESGVAFEVPVDAIVLDEDMLTLYCSVPTDTVFKPEKPGTEPKVKLEQRSIPQPEVRGQRVTAEVEAEVAEGSYPVYDYAWKEDSALHRFLRGFVSRFTPTLALRLDPLLERVAPPRMLPGQHGQQLRVVGIPQGNGTDPVVIGKAQVALIDAFGQVAQDELSVQAYPAIQRTPERKNSGDQPTPTQPSPTPALRTLVAGSIASVVLNAVLVGTLILVSGHGPSGSVSQRPTPTVTLSPTGFLVLPIVPQVCTSLGVTLPQTAIALDNTKGVAGVSWQATIVDMAANGKEPWATFANGVTHDSGSVAAGGVVMETVQPAQDLCTWVARTRTRQIYHVMIDYASGHQVIVTETVDLLLVTAHVVVAATAPQSQVSATTLTQSCNQFDTSNPVQPFGVVLNSSSTVDAMYSVSITDPAPSGGGQPTPTPPGTAPYWAQTNTPNGTLPAGQSVRLIITPLGTLCAGMPPGVPPQAFHVVVRYGGPNAVTLTDVITPQVLG